MKLFNENGSRNIAAERELENLHELQDKAEQMALELAQKTHMLEKSQYVPASADEAAKLHHDAQLTAAAMGHEIIATLRSIMLTSKRPTAQLDAAKALWEIGGRVRGGDGKAGAMPGMNVLVIDKGDMDRELERRRKAGEVKS